MSTVKRATKGLPEAASSSQKRRKVWLVRWRVLRTDLGTQHFVGFSVEECIGWVSTPICSFDAASGVGVTSNGRSFKLLGPPGFDDEAEYVWEHYKLLWKFGEVADVSSAYQVGRHASRGRTTCMLGNGQAVEPRLYGFRRG